MHRPNPLTKSQPIYSQTYEQAFKQMVEILGHRGINQPENNLLPYQNTMEAFEYATSKGADGFELDVIINKEGKCFVIHDDDISKHSNTSTGFISELTTDDITKKTIGKNLQYKIPSLKDILLNFKNKPVTINIEMKGRGIAENVIRELLVSKYPLENIIISSFNHHDLHTVRELSGEITTGILFGKEAKNSKIYEEYLNLLTEKLEPCVYCMEKTIPLLSILESQKDKYFWTIKKEDITNLTVDGLLMYKNVNLITDYPEELVKKVKL